MDLAKEGYLNSPPLLLPNPICQGTLRDFNSVKQIKSHKNNVKANSQWPFSLLVSISVFIE